MNPSCLLYTSADDTLSQSDNATPYTVGGLFQTDYWNYRMFTAICENNKKKVSPGTLGILTNPEPPIFKGFPTEMHTNWQWFPIIKESHPLVLDNFAKDYRQMCIRDRFEGSAYRNGCRNHDGSIFQPQFLVQAHRQDHLGCLLFRHRLCGTVISEQHK